MILHGGPLDGARRQIGPGAVEHREVVVWIRRQHGIVHDPPRPAELGIYRRNLLGRFTWRGSRPIVPPG